MKTAQKWIFIIVCLALIFVLFVLPLKTEAYAVQETQYVPEKYLVTEPYPATEEYTDYVSYTYTAPCEEQGMPSYGYQCCRPPGSPGGVGQTPTPGDPAYNPYMIRPVRYCQYQGTKPEIKTRTVTKYRNVERGRVVPRVVEVVKYRQTQIISFSRP